MSEFSPPATQRISNELRRAIQDISDAIHEEMKKTERLINERSKLQAALIAIGEGGTVSAGTTPQVEEDEDMESVKKIVGLK